ncbi:MAG: GTP cyclohydrolase II [Candidatus Micrarchaeota archaeon]|nr:GTP cyclohydrolase II [Candidatus Micrarchaeota archaeon]
MEHVAKAKLPTRFGDFTIHAFVEGTLEHVALIRCEHRSHSGVPVRIHSQCLTGDALSSKKCDCRDQLEAAMKYLEEHKCGVLIYLDQEGRGIGLSNKIKAYALQDQGRDTVEANRELGFCDDARDFKVAADILKFFEITEIKLMTNNPKKIEDLEKHGIKVVERIPIISKPTKYNEKYLKTKKEKMNHKL